MLKNSLGAVFGQGTAELAYFCSHPSDEKIQMHGGHANGWKLERPRGFLRI